MPAVYYLHMNCLRAIFIDILLYNPKNSNGSTSEVYIYVYLSSVYFVFVFQLVIFCMRIINHF